MMFRAVILGAPASGKGTISSRITSYFDVIHLSTGDLLRSQIKSGSKIGKEAEIYVKDGKFVPDDLMLNLVSSELSALTSRNWLLDGFPRTIHQAEALLKDYPINIAVVLDVPIEAIVERVKGRWVHPGSGRVYNESFNAPRIAGRDDITGEPLEQRPDDAPDAVRRRLRLYGETVQPLLEFYKKQGVLHLFSGSTSDEIWPKVYNVLSRILTPKRK